MYSLNLSPEQLQIRDTVRDFVAQEIRPLALAPQRLEASARPVLVEALDKASQIGLRTLALSEEAGGAGADNLTCCIVTEELAAGDPDVAAVLAQTSTLAHALFDGLMTPEQRSRFLPAFLADHRHHLALAEHEPHRDTALGINYHRPQTNEARFATIAARSGDAWIINGRKDRVIGASQAALFAVRASLGDKGAGTLLVPRDTPGLTVTPSEANERWHHGACGALVLQDCRVPAENCLAADAALFAHAGRGIPQDAALNLGIGRAAYEAALDYAQLRVQGGASSSIRQSGQSSPRSPSGSRLRAPPFGRRPGRRTILTPSPSAASPICRSPPLPAYSQQRRSTAPSRTRRNVSAPWASCATCRCTNTFMMPASVSTPARERARRSCASPRRWRAIAGQRLPPPFSRRSEERAGPWILP
jgi:alkylation response protein AidB-like acyl-CoA dehydrogenase